ncbi:MAG: PSD1 and planctomycete cytochrome C domain-containing protein [Rubripirellula sp.]|nr:PSD1 and planctomycete cytochrome C domain-containing protein [Rubripirellula sp.]
MACIVSGIQLLCSGIAQSGDVADDFFESRIRPVLIAHCQSCHGIKKQSGGLRLDHREALLVGGHTGPAVIPGNPEDSLLVQAVRHTGDYEMPPEQQLPESTIRDLEQWIKLGLPWPLTHDTTSNANREARWKGASKHWAFQPIQQPLVPEIGAAGISSRAATGIAGQATTQVGTPQVVRPVDAFVQRRIFDHGLRFSPQADRRTLIRRVTYSLTGLPPTPAEVHDYVNDRGPNAYERLVERLLASVHYGEHWARHWLDVGRYSDTKGYVYGREERFWPHAWAYRDWVVNSFNDDLPYNRFLLLQLAADQVKDRRSDDLAAMGFLTLGRRFLGVRREIIDDRIDVVSRGMMGLTVSCARCHDHKFDPIPSADYYSLYGVFDSCIEQLVRLDGDSRQGNIVTPRASDDASFEVELEKRQAQLSEKLAARRAEANARVRQRVADYLFAQSELDKYPANGFDQIFESSDLLPAVVRRWSTYLRKASQQQDLLFLPWQLYAGIPAGEFAQQSAQIIQRIKSRHGDVLNPRIAEQFETPPSSLRDVCDRYGEVFRQVEQEWQRQIEQAKAGGEASPTRLSDSNAESLRAFLYDQDSPCQMPVCSIIDCETFFDSAACTELWKLQGEVDRWIIQSKSQPFALTLKDISYPKQPRIFRRGDPLKLGRDVPRQFLAVLAGPQRHPFQHGSGRLELANAIIDPTNPLTARVMVNRVWMHHFGHGLVSTPSDFGTRAAPPSHPDLLDWLATDFAKNGWSVKALHRRILLSETYRQSSFGPNDTTQLQLAQQTDPDNELLWRFNAQRLGFEELRDSILLANGQLDSTMGGNSVPLFKTPYPTRRTLYGLVDRQYLPGTLRIFDFANPDLHVPKRSETTVPQQALFFMNHPWILQQARKLAKEIQQTNGGPVVDDRRAIADLFQRLLQRNPTEEEYNDSLGLIASATQKTELAARSTEPNWSYGYGPFDETSNTISQFTPLPHFTGTAWQGGHVFPDPALGWVQLTSTGGHPGNDHQHAAVRRWTADRDMRVSIQSNLKHEPELGDGIRAFVVSSDGRLHHRVSLHHNSRQLDVDTLAVKRGDTVDFIVDIGAGLNNDQYLWTTVIQEIGSAGKEITWNSELDFPTPAIDRLDGWEQLTQVLLCSNEFMFID